jgi:hypothetical protein
MNIALSTGSGYVADMEESVQSPCVLPPAISLSDILRVEDDPELLDVRCEQTGIPLWVTVRFEFLRGIIVDRLYGSPMAAAAVPRLARLSGAMGKVLTLTRSMLHNRRWMLAHREKFPVMVVSSGARLAERQGRYVNCLSDYFIAAYQQHTVALESLFDWHWPFPRHQRNTLVHTPLLLLDARRSARRAPACRKDATHLIDIAIARASRHLGWRPSADARESLIDRCAAESASLPLRYASYRRLLRKMGTRLLIAEGACYGGAANAAMIMAARELGIASAEYQHGQISSGHDGYNFAPAVRQHRAYRETLPDTLLTYGSWWSEQVNAPVAKVAVGHPHRAETLRSGKVHARRKSLLVLGEAFDTQMYLEMCEQLARTCTDYEVIFRPHPLERAVVRGLGNRSSSVRVDLNDDIYDSFGETEVLLGEVSTALFEAVGVVPRIFVWDTPKSRFHVPTHPFARVADVSGLPDVLSDPDSGRVGAHEADAVWAPGWHANYLNFLEEVLR